MLTREEVSTMVRQIGHYQKLAFVLENRRKNTRSAAVAEGNCGEGTCGSEIHNERERSRLVGC